MTHRSVKGMKVTKGQVPSGCSWTARAADDHEVSTARDIFMVTKTHENGGGKFYDRVSWFIDFSVGYALQETVRSLNQQG
jgi:hypothetical protein